MEFCYWMENNRPQICSYDKYGNIVFIVGGKKYPYILDPVLFFQRGQFKNWMTYAPGKAFNYARTHGIRSDIVPEKKQGFLF